MSTDPPRPTLALIGLGNRYRSDDGVGTLVADRAAREARLPIEAVSPADTTDLVDVWAGSDLAVVVDATRSGSPPGTVRCVELRGAELTLPTVTSSHSLGLCAALRISRLLGTAPRRVVLIGVEGSRFEPGERLSAAVDEAVPVAVEAVVRLIETYRSELPVRPPGHAAAGVGP